MRTGLASALLVTCGASIAQSPPTPPPPILVDPAAFRCLLARLDDVPREPRGVFVDFGACERRGIRIVRHLYAPTPQRDPRGIESILFVKPQQLACMKRHRLDAARLLETLPDNRHRLWINPCGHR